jgi:hypothetical protein
MMERIMDRRRQMENKRGIPPLHEINIRAEEKRVW